MCSNLIKIVLPIRPCHCAAHLIEIALPQCGTYFFRENTRLFNQIMIRCVWCLFPIQRDNPIAVISIALTCPHLIIYMILIHFRRLHICTMLMNELLTLIPSNSIYFWMDGHTEWNICEKIVCFHLLSGNVLGDEFISCISHKTPRIKKR